MRWIITILVFFTVGCQCLEVLTSDSSPASAGMIIEWEDIQSQLQSQTFSTLDSDTTILVSKTHPITLNYLGSDSEGTQSIHLEYDMVHYGNSPAFSMTSINPLISDVIIILIVATFVTCFWIVIQI